MSLQMENALPDGFVFEKAQNVIHGTYRGIDLLIVPMDAENQYQIQFYANPQAIENKEGFLEYLGSMPADYPFVHHAGYNGSNLVSVFVLSKGAEDKDNLTAAISDLVSKCTEYGLHNCCAHCKSNSPLHAVAVDQTPLLLCDNCLSQVMGRMGGKRQREENVLLGLIGAIVGVLLGSVLWVVIGQIGFIAGIAGFAIVYGGMKGYELLGGRLSKAGIVICVLLSLLMVVGAEVVSIVVALYRELSGMYAVTLSDIINLLPELFKEPDVVAGVAKDLVVGYALAIWASYANIKVAWRQVEEGAVEHNVVKF